MTTSIPINLCGRSSRAAAWRKYFVIHLFLNLPLAFKERRVIYMQQWFNSFPLFHTGAKLNIVNSEENLQIGFQNWQRGIFYVRHTPIFEIYWNNWISRC
jgi:hypothetical protein